jgi:hypothetical protein
MVTKFHTILPLFADSDSDSSANIQALQMSGSKKIQVHHTAQNIKAEPEIT